MTPRLRLTRTPEKKERSAGHAGQRAADANGLGLQSTIGNRATVALLAAGQAKLVVGGAIDRFEVEADSVAEKVTSRLAAPAVAREESEQNELEEEEAPVDRTISRVQRKPAPIGREGGDVDAETESTIAAARGGGRPLPGGLRNSFEQAFGARFDAVRVHRGEQSAALNRQVGAQAFTVGSDIFLGASAPEADSDSGKHLLAHELTHTIQQGASKPRQ